MPDWGRPGAPTHDWAVGEDAYLLSRADDWQCLDGAPIADLHWWGNYGLWGDDADLGIEMRGSGVGAFRLSIREDVDNLPGGVPGTVLWATMVWFDALIEVDTGQQTVEGSSVYRYDYILEEPFLQVADRYYWLEIAAMSPDPSNPALWRWQESSLAVAPNLIPGSAESILESALPPGVWTPLDDIDLAFEITKDVDLDWGDAPDLGIGTGPGDYQTLAVDQGANHIIRGPWFGDPTDRPDAEPDGQPHFVALGDDLDTIYGPPSNDDEDGVVLAPMVAGSTTTIQYEVNGAPGASYYVDGWIDWNGNGVWEGWEQILNSNGGTTPVGIYRTTIAVPALAQGVQPGQTFARFRINSVAPQLPTGGAPDGEVEDHVVTVLPQPPPNFDFGDAPDAPYPTLLAGNGARHIINLNGPWLGGLPGDLDSPDAEPDGQPHPKAWGDDLDTFFGPPVNDDEDGVVLPPVLIPGTQAFVTVYVANALGVLNAWVDFTADGDWSDAGEQVFANLPLPPGTHNLSFPVPAGTSVNATTFARFRIASAPGLSFLGQANDGEVEDYEVRTGAVLLPIPPASPIPVPIPIPTPPGAFPFAVPAPPWVPPPPVPPPPFIPPQPIPNPGSPWIPPVLIPPPTPPPTPVPPPPVPVCWLHPATALGYDFEILSTPGSFDGVILPVGFTDSAYDIYAWNGSAFVLEAAGFVSDGLTPYLFATAQTKFRVLGIEAAANVDPADPAGFPWAPVFNVGTAFPAVVTQTGLPETIYVDDPTHDDLRLDVDNDGLAGIGPFDEVTWRPGTPEEVTGLIFGHTAWDSIQSAIAAAVEGVTTTIEIAPGTYPESVDATSKTLALSAVGAGTGQIALQGNLTLDSGNALAIDLQGTTAGSGYDQWVVNGTVNLGGNLLGVDGAQLICTSSVTLPIGATFLIIDNDQSDPISTRFLNLPDNASLAAPPNTPLLNISYRAGTNANDVVLTAPGRYDFNGFGNHTEDHYMGVSPFQAKDGNTAGWVTTAPYYLPWYFERGDASAPGWDRLRYDGQSTNTMGDPLRFQVDVAAGQTYEVMILTGDASWNYDQESFTVTGTPAAAAGSSDSQVVSVWGAGAPDGSGGHVTWGGGAANPGSGYYRWVRLTVTVGGTPGDIGTITLDMDDLGGSNGTTVILALDIRPVERVGQLTLVRAEPPGTPTGTPPKFSTLPADGTTKDKYTGTGAPPNAVLTVTVSAGGQYATVTPDSALAVTPHGDLATFGAQIQATAAGTFEFWVQRPATLTNTAAAPPVTTEDWTIVVEESSGLSRGTELQPYEAPGAADSAPLRFDFGTATSPVAANFLQVVPQTIYNATRGYGWATRVAAGDRRDTVSAAGTPLRTDFNSGRNATFKVDLPDGLYNVRLYHSNPLYFGSVPYTTQPFQVQVEGSPIYTVPVIAPGTTHIEVVSNVSVSGGTLEILFGAASTAFLIAGIDISAGTLPGEQPLLATGNPRDAGAAAIGLTQLQPVAAEAAAWWTATGLTAAQAATLANVQFAVADLGGAYLGLANPATNTVRIDDDAAMFGWSVVSGQWAVGSDRRSVIGDRLPITDYQSPDPGLDLLTVVMHELGHLLGYGHSDDPGDLMAPVLSASLLRASSSIFHPSSFIPHPSSLIAHPSSRVDEVFGQWGDNSGSGNSASRLLEANEEAALAAATARASDEATQAKVPRRIRLQRHERELEEWFAELAVGDR